MIKPTNDKVLQHNVNVNQLNDKVANLTHQVFLNSTSEASLIEKL